MTAPRLDAAAIRWLLVSLLVLLVGSGSVLAQDTSAETSADVEERKARLDEFQPEVDPAFPDAPAKSRMSGETATAYQETLRSYFEYRERGYAHRLAVFEWQSLSTQIIFVVVLVLVFAGIYFAAIQFHVGLRRRSDGQQSEGQPGETEISLSLGELKVRSPVLGVIILVISLAFFYLYLVHVYPIRNVF